MEAPELHARLMEDARRYDPAAHTRGLLAPYRNVLLLQRAKFMSYEQISATLTRHGLTVSPAAVGVYCRRNFTKAEIDRARRALPAVSARPERTATGSAPGASTPRPGYALTPHAGNGGRRGPKIARDNY